MKLPELHCQVLSRYGIGVDMIDIPAASERGVRYVQIFCPSNRISGGAVTDAPVRLNEPVLRWRSRAHSIEEIEQELTRIWAEPDLQTQVGGQPGRHVAARTSVMNLVVIARRPEVGERSAVASEMAVALGVKDVVNFRGGTKAWKDAGLPLDKP